MQSSSEVVINKHHSIFKQKQPIDRIFFSSKKINYVFVSATALNLRSDPGVKNTVLRIIPRGTHMLSLSSQNTDWLKVYVPHNFEGWVARKHVKFYHPGISIHIDISKMTYPHLCLKFNVRFGLKPSIYGLPYFNLKNSVFSPC